MSFLRTSLLVGSVLTPSISAISADEAATKQLYMQSCGVCHGADGMGMGGAFPPLAKSEWVGSNPDRMIQIILHGLKGPIKVAGKEYNLVMPPQGVSLDDEQIAEITTYIRKSFGNEAPAVTKKIVAKAREATKNRVGQWTGPELLKLFPLPESARPIVLENVLSYFHKGTFKGTNDLWNREADAIEEEKSGILDVNNYELDDNYGLVFTGDLIVRKTGAYKFLLDADDSADFHIDGRRVANVGGKGPMNGSRAKQGNVLLKAGRHKFRIHFLEYEGNSGLTIKMTGPDHPNGIFITKGTTEKKGRTWPSIILKPTETEPVIYRNFIGGASARGIGVGYPQGINLAFSADDLGPTMVWKGDFIDAGRHWTGRGQGYEPPAGEHHMIFDKGPQWAVLDKPSSQWPKGRDVKRTNFEGYRLDQETRQPVFSYRIADAAITDNFVPTESQLTRELTVLRKPEEGALALHTRVATSQQIKDLGDGQFELAEGGVVSIAGEGVVPTIVGKSLILTFPPSTKSAATVSYIWK